MVTKLTDTQKRFTSTKKSDFALRIRFASVLADGNEYKINNRFNTKSSNKQLVFKHLS